MGLSTPFTPPKITSRNCRFLCTQIWVLLLSNSKTKQFILLFDYNITLIQPHNRCKWIYNNLWLKTFICKKIINLFTPSSNLLTTADVCEHVYTRMVCKEEVLLQGLMRHLSLGMSSIGLIGQIDTFQVFSNENDFVVYGSLFTFM